MKYLVTGAAGFIGQHLTRTLLTQGHTVLGVDIKPRPQNFEGGYHQDNILDLPRMCALAQGCDGIFHLAAVASVVKTIEDPIGTHTTNVTGTLHMFEAARHGGNIPVVYASSAAVYGDQTALPLKETALCHPLSPYAAHKLDNENDAKAYGKAFGLPSFGLRFFNLYGAGQDPTSPYSGVISIFHSTLLAGTPLTLFGDGTQTRDFVAVEDAITGLIHAMQQASPAAPVTNLCTGTQTSLLVLAQTLGGVLNVTPQILHKAPRGGDIKHSCGDPTLCQTLTGFKPALSLMDGLKHLA